MPPVASDFDPLVLSGTVVLAGFLCVAYVVAIFQTIVRLRKRLSINHTMLLSPLVIIAWSAVFYFITDRLFG